jgi:hypothetical protein
MGQWIQGGVPVDIPHLPRAGDAALHCKEMLRARAARAVPLPGARAAPRPAE